MASLKGKNISFSSSNLQRINGNHHHNHQLVEDIDVMQNCHTSTSLSSESGEPSGTTTITTSGAKWASKLLRECARAISDKDSSKIHHLLWMLNELASPYGDCDQKLASYFLQALFCKATESGQRCFKTLTTVAERAHSFDSARKLILKFQEASPWTTFGHVASNGAILEAIDGETKLHIIDISNTLCTQWPTLLEALATRNNDTPSLKLTIVATSSMVRSVIIKEIGQRMAKFARLMGVPFELNVISDLNHLGQLTKETLNVKDDEALAINCIGSLRRVEIEERVSMIKLFQSLKPKILTIVEEEADFSTNKRDFVKCFEECLRFYTLYFEMLEVSFVTTSNERLMLERECSRSIVRILGCDDDDVVDNDVNKNGNDQINYYDSERRERGKQWIERLRHEFSPVRFSDDVVDDVKALLKRYRSGWSLVIPSSSSSLGSDSKSDHDGFDDSGAYLAWKEEAVVWASAWKP